MGLKIILILITLVGIWLLFGTLPIIFKISTYTKIESVCTYVEDEKKFADDAISDGKGYRCKYSFLYNGEEYKFIDKGVRFKIEVGEIYPLYINPVEKDVITRTMAENYICKCLASVALIIFAIYHFSSIF